MQKVYIICGNVKTLCLFVFYIKNGVEDINIDALLIQISITDGMRLALQHIGILFFFLAAILKTIQNGGWDPRY